MMEFSLSTNKKEIFLALDIGTDAIKSLIFRIENKKPIILGADLKEYYYLGVSDGRAFDKGAMREVIAEVVARAREQANIKKGKLRTIIGFSGNVLKEKVFRQSTERKNPGKNISDKEEKEIYQKIFTEARDEIAKENFQRTGITPKDLHFLDFKINEIKIDGFEVGSLAGFTGKNIEFEALYIFLPANYLSIGKRIGKELNLDSLAMASKAENLTIALPDPKATGIFLDIGGETTQIILLEEGKIKMVDNFDTGGDIFSQKLARDLGISQAHAEELKLKYSQKTLSEEVRSRVREVLLVGGQLWINSLKLRLRDFLAEEKKIFPPKIFIFGGGSLLPEIKEILTGDNWEEIPFLSRPETMVLLPKDLKPFDDLSKKANSPQYTSTLLLCYPNG